MKALHQRIVEQIKKESRELDVFGVGPVLYEENVSDTFAQRLDLLMLLPPKNENKSMFLLKFEYYNFSYGLQGLTLMML